MQFKEWLIIESKQEILNLGYPAVIAKLLYEKFGNNAFLMARWFKEYKYNSNEIPDNWWLLSMGDYRRRSLYDLTRLYTASADLEDYKKVLDRLEINYKNDEINQNYLQEQRQKLYHQIKNEFFGNAFFIYYSIVKDIEDKKITDLAPYKNLRFQDAVNKYESKKIFKDTKAIKTYKNGWKWIDVGVRSNLIASLMKNCGSAVLMGNDPDRTIVALFDANQNPHVMLTYSPNEKRLSSDTGVAHTSLKSKYHHYVIDLSGFLGAIFDADKSDSTDLKVKYLLKDKATNIRNMGFKSLWDKNFKFKSGDHTYYTNGYVVVSEEDVERVQVGIQKGNIQLRNNQNHIIKNIFNHMNQPILANYGIKYIPIKQFNQPNQVI